MFKGFIDGIKRKWKGKKLYNEILISSLADGDFSESEIEKLNSIKKEFNLNTKSLLRIHRRAFNVLFKKLVDDGVISEKEHQSLHKVSTYIEQSSADFRLVQKDFNRFRLIGMIDEGNLPDLKSDSIGVNLKTSEVLHYAVPSSLIKLKKVTERINYSAVTGSIRIAKGVHYRIGSIKPQAIRKEVAATDDTGYFWISSNRVGFKGGRKHMNIPLDKLMSLEYVDGILKVFKDGKEAPYLLVLTDYDLVMKLIDHLLSKLDNQIA